MNSHQRPKGSRTAKITAIFGDDYYDMKLDFEALVELEEKTDRGAFFILRRLSDFDHVGYVGDFKIVWLTEIIRLGLIGGGMKATKALKLTDRYLREGFALDYLQVATNALYAAIHGPEEEPVVYEKPQSGEPEPEVDQMTPTPSAASNGENIGSSPEPSELTPNPSDE